MTATDGDEELAALLVAAGVETRLSQRLAAYGSLLLEANRQVNLTGARDAAALVPHLLDSLTLVPLLAPDANLIDVGSGGGLPGMPLAIATGIRVTLVEPIAKKAAFLGKALTACGVDGEVIAARAEVVARDPRHREQYLAATARAVSRAPTVAELTLPFLRVGGRALLQRGSLDARERQALEDAAPVLGGAVIGEEQLDGEKRIVIVEKRVPSGERFPRRNGVPEKRPLCWE